MGGRWAFLTAFSYWFVNLFIPEGGDNDGAHEGLDATLKVVKEHADRLSAANALDLSLIHI